jgi:membrane-bound lytic murein transglycosylase B
MKALLQGASLVGIAVLQACSTPPPPAPPAPAPAPPALPTPAVVAPAASAPAEAPEPPPQAALPASGVPAPGRYAERSEVQAFARDVAQRHPELGTVADTLAQAQYQPTVARLIMPAATPAAKNWTAYRARFVEPKRIQAGVQFATAQAAALQAAEQRWGVPASIIAAIIGVETFYGRNTGNYRALDALATLAFDFPTGRSDRSTFFRDELEALLLLSQREGQPVASYVGSYAGALGLPQFMPSSWLRYAVDFDGDGRIDLLGSPVDAIGSVANFLAAHGWQPGLPSRYGAAPPPPGPALDQLLGPDILPSFRADEMQQLGAVLAPEGKSAPGLLALVELKNGDATPTYIAGTQNFYVLTRYNRSSYYALSIVDLAQAIAARVGPN